MDPFDVDSPSMDWDDGPVAPPQQETPMYEPDADPPGNDNSAQWAPYDNTAFIPPQDDFAVDPPGISQPPPGRQYGMYRQQPTWQHASLEGVPEGTVKWTELIQGLTAILAGAGLGYALTASPKAAAGSGIAMLGALQLPLILTGNIVRPLIGAAAIAGAYFLAKDDLEVLALPNGEWDDEDDDYEQNDHDDDDGDDDDEDEVDSEVPKGPVDPAASSPWMKHTS